VLARQYDAGLYAHQKSYISHEQSPLVLQKSPITQNQGFDAAVRRRFLHTPKEHQKSTKRALFSNQKGRILPQRSPQLAEYTAGLYSHSKELDSPLKRAVSSIKSAQFYRSTTQVSARTKRALCSTQKSRILHQISSILAEHDASLYIH